MSEFPVTGVLQSHVVTGRTLRKSNGWWTAILLVNDPKTSRSQLIFYRWDWKGDRWRERKSFPIHDRQCVDLAINVLTELKARLPAE